MILSESDRLLLRTWSFPEDAKAIFEIYQNPEVTHFLPTLRVVAETEASISRFFQQKLATLHARNNGTNWWAIVEKSTHNIIGTIVLQNIPDNQRNTTSDYEIGWDLRRESWGKGYVTEAAKEVINHGFNVLNLPILYAVVHPENERSIRVTQRLGMQPMGLSNQYYGMKLLLFRLDKI